MGWQPAEHNIPKHDDRLHPTYVICLANKAVDACAKSAAEGGRDHELDYLVRLLLDARSCRTSI